MAGLLTIGPGRKGWTPETAGAEGGRRVAGDRRYAGSRWRAGAALLLLPALVAAPFDAARAAWPPSKCTHVEVLRSSDTDQVSYRFDGGLLAGNARLRDAETRQLEVLGEALDLLPEILCQAVRRVAFIERPDSPGIIGWSTPLGRQDIVHLNTVSASPWNAQNLKNSPGARYEAIHRFVHESVHAAVRLIQSQQKASPLGPLQSRPDADLWPAPARDPARNIIARARLEGGILREWQRIHDAFVDGGFAAPYYGGGWREQAGSSPSKFVTDGFTSAYGGEDLMEDLAEIGSWAIVRQLFPSSHAAREDAACAGMNGRQGTSITRELAAVYTKMGFAQSLGFIEDSSFKNCVGRLAISGQGEGFHSSGGSKPPRSYTGDVGASIGQVGGSDRYVFEMTATGTVSITGDGSVPAMVRLRLDVTPDRLVTSLVDIEEASFPRGIYFLGSRYGNRNNDLRIIRSDTGAVVVEVSQGIALVTRASCELVEGSVAIQQYFNFSGGLLSAIGGDEPVTDDPHNITFRMQGRCR